MSTTNLVPSSPKKVKLGTEEADGLRKLYRQMKLKRMCAVAMFLLTDELIYKLVIQTIDEARKVLKKLLNWGTCFFATERKTARLLEKFSRHEKAYHAMLYKMEIAMMPTRADKVISAWLKETHPEELNDFSEENKEHAVVQILGVKEHTVNEAVIIWEFTV